MNEENKITRNPLCWPESVARTAPHQRSRPAFMERSISAAVTSLLQEINRLNERRWDYQDSSVIISSNLKLRQDGLPISGQLEPVDTGVAVYFSLVIRRAGKATSMPYVMACDRWNKVNFNISAIFKDIEAQRARIRWGVTNYEQAFRGYLAIPAKCGGFTWWDFLSVKSTATKEQIDEAFKAKAKIYHPSGTEPNEENWHKLQMAKEQGYNNLGVK